MVVTHYIKPFRTRAERHMRYFNVSFLSSHRDKDLHLSVSVPALQKKTKSTIPPHNPSLEASKGLIHQFNERHELPFRRRTSLCQRLLPQLESKISSFYSKCAKLVMVGKYQFPLISNMDETPVFFDMMPERSLVPTAKNSVTIWFLGSEKRHVTVILRAAADGFIFPPMI